MQKIISGLFLAAVLLSASGVKAEVPDGTLIDKSITAPLMAWVEQKTGTHIPALPQVIASHSHFNLILDDIDGGFFGRPKSAYIPGTVIMDNRTWNPKDPVQLSLLVHELVHHAQLFMTFKKWPCPNAREAEAYELQNKWLKEQGQAPFVGAAWIERVSSCGASGSHV